jgi:hypothetical protein
MIHIELFYLKKHQWIINICVILITSSKDSNQVILFEKTLVDNKYLCNTDCFIKELISNYFILKNISEQ